jgi:hypothetical protein
MIAEVVGWVGGGFSTGTDVVGDGCAGGETGDTSITFHLNGSN